VVDAPSEPVVAWVACGHEKIRSGTMIGSPKVKQFRVDRPLRSHARGAAGEHCGDGPSTGNSGDQS
jgi:hypothetical protein